MMRWGWSWGGSSARHTRLADDSGHSMGGISSSGRGDVDVDVSVSGAGGGGVSARSDEETTVIFSPVHNKSAFSIVSNTEDEEEDE